MNKELSDFAARLRNSISSGFQNESFESLALELFGLQFKNNPACRKICEARKLTPEIIEHWTQIPFVPTSAFKELELTSLAPNECVAVFHSSGTTEQKPSRHFHCAESLKLYETSLWPWFERNVLRSAGGSPASSAETRGRAARAPVAMICLTPPPEQAPNSSLVHMFEVIRQRLGASKNVFVGKISADGTWTLDFDAVFVTLNNSTLNSQPSTILSGTAFSFVHLLDFLAENDFQFQLPENSLVMETGGYKNRSRTMPKSELHSLISKFLGVPRKNIVCEYGMSELSSQAYDLGAPASRRRDFSNSKSELAGETTALSGCVSRYFRFPPWARVQIISPETGREVADGETGLIRVFDLANVFSVAAIQTEDLGIRRGDGFELIGRAQLAEQRGCSLMSA